MPAALVALWWIFVVLGSDRGTSRLLVGWQPITAVNKHGSVATCPSVVPRSSWGAKPAVRKMSIRPAVGYVVIHHTVMGNCTTQATCSEVIRLIQTYHQKTRKWADIGYNFLIGGDGRIYEGRGWKTLGAHASGYNSRSVGIAFIGDYSSVEPPSNMVTLASELIECGVSKGFITSRYNLTGHRQVSQTECPGNLLYALLRSWPHYRSKL